MTAAPSRKGFTLVELLVVTGLIGTFLALVLSGFRASEDSDIRRAADILASAIRNTQTLALTNPQGAALVITAGTATAATASIWQGSVLPNIQGTGFFTPANTFASGTLAVLSLFNADSLAAGYQIRFSTFGANGNSSTSTPWFNLDGVSSPALVYMQQELGQLAATAVMPPSGNVSFEVPQRPMQSKPIVLPKLAAIDTRWSSIGQDINNTEPFRNIVAAAASTDSMAIPASMPPYANSFLGMAQQNSGITDIAIYFDRTGAVSSVVALPAASAPTKLFAPIKPTAPIYFLISSSATIVSSTNPLDVIRTTSPIWVAVDPQTGAVRTGKNQPGGSPLGLGKDAALTRVDTYFRSLRASVLPSVFVEATK
jgi:prepilin-type N-terminal cleavage/methylation domain-containing protein